LFLTQCHEINKKDSETIQEFNQIFDGLVKLTSKDLNTSRYDGNELCHPYSIEVYNVVISTSSSPFTARSWKVVCLSSFIATKTSKNRLSLVSACAPPFNRAHTKENIKNT
jgi:hypothetical protein